MTGSDAVWILPLVLLGVVGMVLLVTMGGRRNRDTMSREHAERDGLHGPEGLRRAQERRDEHN